MVKLTDDELLKEMEDTIIDSILAHMPIFIYSTRISTE